MFGILNTLLFFPSGSIYPIQAFPKWLRVIARGDPFTYAVDGFKCLLLKETTLAAAEAIDDRSCDRRDRVVRVRAYEFVETARRRICEQVVRSI